MLNYFCGAEAAKKLSLGDGIFIQENYMPETCVDELTELANCYTADRKGTVRGLLNKTNIFLDLFSHRPMSATCRDIFISRAAIGSVDIKVFEPEVRHDRIKIGQHVDFPGASAIGASEGQVGRFGGLNLGLKVFIPLTDLTIESGATVYVPGSQLWNADPELHGDLFFDLADRNLTRQLLVPRGSLAMWNNKLWHADLPNFSQSRKILLHICIVPDFVLPPHDLTRMYGAKLISELNSAINAGSSDANQDGS